MASSENTLPRELISYYIKQNEWVPTVPRGPVAAMHNSPGPAIVALPTTIGADGHDLSRRKAPSYQMGQRLDIESREVGPGPAAYDVRGWTNQGEDRCIAPLMGIKLKPLSRHKTPGPADYYRDRCDAAVYNRAPIFSMRRKLGDPGTFKTPAPNTYTLPSVMGWSQTPYANRAPAYTMGYRLDDVRQGWGPGPAGYLLPDSNRYKSAAPSYSMPKAGPIRWGHVGPSPQEYKAELTNYDKYSPPKCTFGIKHTPYKAFPGFAAEK